MNAGTLETVIFKTGSAPNETHTIAYAGLLTALKNSGIIIGNRDDGLRPMLGDVTELWIHNVSE